MKKILLFSLIINSFNLYCACEEKMGRYIFKNKNMLQKEIFCFEKKKASSMNCFPLTKKECFFSKKEAKIKLSRFVLPIGSPGFLLCHHLKGLPQMYQIEMEKNRWEPYERCLAPDKKDFVDIGDLISFYK